MLYTRGQIARRESAVLNQGARRLRVLSRKPGRGVRANAVSAAGV